MLRARGYSIVETLVVLAIISTLFAISLPFYVKAIRQAKDAAADEAMRQRYLGNEGGAFLDNFTPFSCDVVAAGVEGDSFLRACARAAYRQRIDAGKFDLYVTELLYRIESEEQFIAYWHTLIGPEESVPVTFTAGGSLIAYTPGGDVFTLNPIERAITPGATDTYIVGWEFLSTNMANMNSESRYINVMFSNGQRQRLQYGSTLPASHTVAELSQRFMDDVYAGDQG